MQNSIYRNIQLPGHFYGFQFTCFSESKLSWVVQYDNIKEHREVAQKWAKGFYHTGTGSFQKENPVEISDGMYAWVPFWIKNHFVNKIFDFIIILR